MSNLAGTTWRFNDRIDVVTDIMIKNNNDELFTTNDDLVKQCIALYTDGESMCYMFIDEEFTSYYYPYNEGPTFGYDEPTYWGNNTEMKEITFTNEPNYFSPDEATALNWLRSNAVMTYAPPIENLGGTSWQFSHVLTRPAADITFTGDFKVEDTTYSSCTITSSGTVTYGSTQVYTSAWSNEKYARIIFMGEPSAYTPDRDTFIDWLRENGAEIDTIFQVDGDALQAWADDLRDKKNLISGTVLIWPEAFASAMRLDDVEYEAEGLNYREITEGFPWAQDLNGIIYIDGSDILSSQQCEQILTRGPYFFVLNSNITRIGFKVFQSYNKLSTITASGCTTIGSYAFQSCSALTSVNFPECKTIGSYTFESCSALTSADFPECTLIDMSAFHNCSALTSANFPKCTTIGAYAFRNCSALTSANFPECTIINMSAFYSCGALTSANFPKCMTISAYAFYNCDALTSVNFPACKLINSYAFYNCQTLTSTNFPVCSNIWSHAFRSCTALAVISFPKCSYIYSYAFANCTSLSSAYFLGSTYITGSNYMFMSTPLSNSTYIGKYGSIYFRASMLSSYKKRSYWSAYAKRMVGLTDEQIAALGV